MFSERNYKMFEDATYRKMLLSLEENIRNNEIKAIENDSLRQGSEKLNYVVKRVCISRFIREICFKGHIVSPFDMHSFMQLQCLRISNLKTT